MVIDDPVTGAAFQAYVEEVLATHLRPDVRASIEAAGAILV